MRRRGMWIAVPVALPQLLFAQVRKPAATASPRAAISTAAIASKAIPATVTIISIDAQGDTLGQGSGFLVRSTGAIITNWHVMRGASRAVVILASRERYDRVSFLDGNEAADIAIIKIPGYDLPTLPIRSTVPAVGERVIAIGSPLGLSQTVSEGIVSATRMVDGRQLVQISAPISPGSSGGAVLDGEGRVFAISTSYLEGGQQLNFAVPVRYALGLIAARPEPRPLATVFSKISTGAPAAADPASRPTPARTPAAKLTGAFSVSERWKGPDFTDGSRRLFGLLIAGDRVGWLEDAFVLPDGSLGRTSVYNIRSLRTNSAGEVVLDAGGMVFDGFQTDAPGFYLASSARLKVGVDSLHLRGTPTTIKLSHPTGLYSITCRTQFISDAGAYLDTVDWEGELAAVVANDSVYIDLYMSNAEGGETMLVGSGRLDGNQSFSILSPVDRGTRWNHETTWLKGRIRAGVLSGSWEDSREHGKFDGTCDAERR